MVFFNGDRTKSNQRWMKLRTTVQLSSAIQKKPPLKREDSFLKRFSTRQSPTTQETVSVCKYIQWFLAFNGLLTKIHKVAEVSTKLRSSVFSNLLSTKSKNMSHICKLQTNAGWHIRLLNIEAPVSIGQCIENARNTYEIEHLLGTCS